ncbi:MAG: TlpA family protein disulfide reductase [Planctomycetes bacterium]|nr:TlpA family protein disulfide reductase [Planctomycetota bacterium]
MLHWSRSLCVLIVGLWSAAILVGPARGADPKDARSERLKEIIGEYEKKAQAFVSAFEKAKTDADRAQIEKKMRPSDAECGGKLVAFAKDVPGDKAAFDALVYVFENLDAPDAAAVRDEAVALFEKHQLKSPRLKIAIPRLAGCNSAKAEALLEKLGDKGETPDIRGLALFRLAQGRYERSAGKDEKHMAQIESLLARVQKDYGDVQPDDEDQPLAKLTAGALFEIRHLRPGKQLPEISGTDVAGKPLKLSSYRGKVVLLVFWGSWCGPCMAKVPFERRLMEKFAGRPFTVVGVNCGDQKKKAAAVIKEQKMNWPSFFDGEDGPIVTEWSINSFPTVFLVDSEGVILHRDPPDEFELEATIEKAVQALAPAKK